MLVQEASRQRMARLSPGRGWNFTFLALLAVAPAGAQPANRPTSSDPENPEVPRYTDDGALIRPTDYREWIFLTSGLGMTYGPSVPAATESPRFDNVFASRSTYQSFLKSGTWPDKTVLILEVRRGEANVSINNGGRTQGDLVAIEAAVKDRERFDGSGWGYFSFDGEHGPTESAKVLPATASCYSCHDTHAAVDNTFVQFYPTLLEVAKRLGTVKPTFDPSRKP